MLYGFVNKTLLQIEIQNFNGHFSFAPMNQRPRLSGGCYITLVLEVLILMPDKTGKYLKYVLSVQYRWSKKSRVCTCQTLQSGPFWPHGLQGELVHNFNA
jgi:hypothetical protein